MANYLKLFDKTLKEDTHLVLVDARICREVYHKEPHEIYWGAQVFNWMIQLDSNYQLVRVWKKSENTSQHLTSGQKNYQ